MPIYFNSQARSPLRSIELEATTQGNAAYLTLTSNSHAEALLSWLNSEDINEHLIAKTEMAGDTVLVMRGHLHPSELLKKFAEHGEVLQTAHKENKIDWWSYRGLLGMTGQTLQLLSATHQVGKLAEGDPMLAASHPKYKPGLEPGMWVRKPFDPAVGYFAILNITANFGNMIYGGQKEDDKNRLQYLKTQLVEDLSPDLKKGITAPDANAPSQAAQNRAVAPKNIFQQTNDFLHRNSVRFFELGMRAVAASALVIPFHKDTLFKGGKLLLQGKPLAAFDAARNKNLFVLAGGCFYLTGKLIAWFSKVPDPYDPKPHTAIDEIQERVLFPMGSIIELCAGLSIAYAAIKSKHIALPAGKNGELNVTRDWMGMTGGGLFALAYAIRMGAKFGSRSIDMKEVMAFSSDIIAKTPEEKRPEMIAKTAAILAEHFSDKNITYGTIYKQLNDAVQKYYPVSSAHPHINLTYHPTHPTPVEETAPTTPGTHIIHQETPHAEPNAPSPVEGKPHTPENKVAEAKPTTHVAHSSHVERLRSAAVEADQQAGFTRASA